MDNLISIHFTDLNGKPSVLKVAHDHEARKQINQVINIAIMNKKSLVNMRLYISNHNRHFTQITMPFDPRDQMRIFKLYHN